MALYFFPWILKLMKPMKRFKHYLITESNNTYSLKYCSLTKKKDFLQSHKNQTYHKTKLSLIRSFILRCRMSEICENILNQQKSCFFVSDIIKNVDILFILQLLQRLFAIFSVTFQTPGTIGNAMLSVTTTLWLCNILLSFRFHRI